LRSLNIFPERKAKRRWLCIWLAAGFLVVGFLNVAYAIDPSRVPSQYIHDRWGVENGFPGGPVYAITQTTDGYLWIGTESGLVRFDGRNFRLMRDLNPASPGSGPVFGLTADLEGNLWLRSLGPMMMRYRDGELKNVKVDLGWPYSAVTAMYTTTHGALLFSEMGSGAIQYRDKEFATLASAEMLPRSPVSAMAQTPDGDIWMGTRDAGLFRLSSGQTVAVNKGLPDQKINCLLAYGEKELWVGTDNGVARWNGSELTQVGIPPSLSRTQIFAMSADRDANIWIGTASGLLRLNRTGVASLDERDQRAGGAVTALFEDREGNLWVGGAQGIERFRDGVFRTYKIAGGRASENPGAVHVDWENRLWFAPADGGLYWLKDGQIGQQSASGLSGDLAYSISGSKGELWIGRQRGGLTQVRSAGGAIAAKTYTQAQGLAQNSVYVVYQSRDGSVWAGTLSGGVSHLKDGKFTTYTSANGLASNTITSILETADRALWFATPNGLSRLSNGQWQRYTTREGLPSQNVHCLFEDSQGELWIGTDNGIALFSSGRIRAFPEASGLLQEPIAGLAQDRTGGLWLATASHVLRVNRDKLFSGSLSDADIRQYGLADGLPGIESVKRHQSVVADASGRIWFSLARGLSVVDPARLTSASMPALVHIQGLTADGSPVDLRSQVRIPATRQRIAFTYTGLSLAIPERVKFRYRLEGFDNHWSEPSSTPEAIYTNLSPGSYRFQVIACNSDGVWNSAEALVQFEIEPMFWQSLWFRLSCGLALGLLLLAFYRFRLHRVTRQLNVRFEERLTERMRIAQDLHDTLLQGFISASMQLHIAVEQLPENANARPKLGRILQLMGQVIEDGRKAVSGLRAADSAAENLELAFSRIQQELAIDEQVHFRIVVEGQPGALHPLIRDEVYRIGREALVNAFRHSAARHIEVEIEYAHHYLRLFIRDDGCGIDSRVLRSGRDGHWGLSGMRERAERIGARLHIRSRSANGTEVELYVPGNIAFRFQSSTIPFKWLAKWFSRKAGTEAIEDKKSEIHE
jgi:ligand-binding sensor domain-containing protein